MSLIQQLEEARYDLGEKTRERVLRYFDQEPTQYSPTGTPMLVYKPKDGIMAKCPIDQDGWIKEFALDGEPVDYEDDGEPVQLAWLQFIGDEDAANYDIDYFFKTLEIYQIRQVL